MRVLIVAVMMALTSTGASGERGRTHLKFPHTHFDRGQRLRIVLRDGRVLVRRFVQRKGRAVIEECTGDEPSVCPYPCTADSRQGIPHIDNCPNRPSVVCPRPCYGGVLITKLEIGGMEGEVREFGPCPLCNANDESGAVALAREAWAQRHAVSGNGVT